MNRSSRLEGALRCRVADPDIFLSSNSFTFAVFGPCVDRFICVMMLKALQWLQKKVADLIRTFVVVVVGIDMSNNIRIRNFVVVVIRDMNFSLGFGIGNSVLDSGWEIRLRIREFE